MRQCLENKKSFWPKSLISVFIAIINLFISACAKILQKLLPLATKVGSIYPALCSINWLGPSLWPRFRARANWWAMTLVERGLRLTMTFYLLLCIVEIRRKGWRLIKLDFLSGKICKARGEARRQKKLRLQLSITHHLETSINVTVWAVSSWPVFAFCPWQSRRGGEGGKFSSLSQSFLFQKEREQRD